MAFGREMERLLWHLIGGTRGGETRARIIRALQDRPYNRNQLAAELDLDYTTVEYHIDTLVDNGIVDEPADAYGAMLHLSEEFSAHEDVFAEIWEKLDKG